MLKPKGKTARALKPKKKLPSIAQLIKKVDAVFNPYIRLRDGACVICGSTESLQCSHYYGKKAHPAVRWATWNAHAMCASCHYKHHNGHEDAYAKWWHENGYDKQLLIYDKEAHEAHKRTRAELEETLAKYIKLLAEIKETW